LANNDALMANDQTSLGDGNLRSWTHTDGLGRVIENWSHDTDTRGDIKVAITYDALSRRIMTSNPFRPATDSEADSTTVFDMAGRVASITPPDNAVVLSYYSGNRVLAKDQAGKERLSAIDALGRLTDIWEITSTDTGTYPSTDAASFAGHTEVSAG